MNQISEDLEKYIIEHTDKEDDLLYELYRETHKKVLHPRMLSGHLQGKLLEMITRMVNPQKVLEIGTYTGYSAICIAKGLDNSATLHTIEINDELQQFIEHYLERSGFRNKINLHIGDALNIIGQLQDDYDLVFIDGDKREYPEYFTACKKKLKPGGFIVADNVLWGGKVTEANNHSDPQTEGIKKFNNMVSADPAFEKLILPLRDGIMLIRKK